MEEVEQPLSLVVLGNGFDLSCGLKSSYIHFFEWILGKKLEIDDVKKETGWNTVVEYCESEIMDYLYQVDFFTSLPKKSFITPDLNIWYCLFLYKKMTKPLDWYLVENQILEEISFSDNVSSKIISEIASSILSIKREDELSDSFPHISIISDGQIIITDRGEADDDIYKLITYNLLNRDVAKLNIVSNKYLYTDLKILVKELLKDFSIDHSIDLISQKIQFELIPLIVDVLLAELNELEFDFNNYLLKQLSVNESYPISAGSKLHKFLGTIPRRFENFDFTHFYNIINFNYTKPWENIGFEWPFFENLIQKVNIHGSINRNYEGIIFGIDDAGIVPSVKEYIFTKASRTFDLYTNGTRGKIKLDSLLTDSIKNIIFFGHSLSTADYGYFRMILEKYIAEEDVKFIFLYSVFEGTSEAKERRKIIANASALFGSYSIESTSNTALFHKLIQNDRISILKI